MNFCTQGDKARFEFIDRFEIDEDVRALLYDRDCLATRECIAEFIGQPLVCLRVMLPHDGHRHETNYEKQWDCAVAFSQTPAGIEFPSALLEIPLPFRDPLASDRLSQQCQLLLAKMTRRGGLAEEVRQILIGRPGYFPDIDVVAQRLRMPVRTLRHRLSDERTGYQAILDEVRFALAREYLLETPLPQHEIAGLLGYTDPGNFTHAFKRWAGASPRQFRIAHAAASLQR
jgi:AraC-like DNA-binding protein